MKHITVLKKEAVSALKLVPTAIVIDATLGSGGHSNEILKQLSATGVLVGIDTDSTAVAMARTTLKGKAKIHLVHANFSQLSAVLADLGITKVDAVLADLGWRSEQFTQIGRGFSFNDEFGLAMTYGDPKDFLFTASDIVNHWEEADIANVIFAYSEERYARKIAKAIVAARATEPLKNARQLTKIINETVPAGYRRGRINPATKTFQALRIAVNDELVVLETFIKQAWEYLKLDGYIAIISFHSLEDRIVKHTFRALVDAESGILINKKPILPSPEEIINNPRSRSAKLRVIKKISQN